MFKKIMSIIGVSIIAISFMGYEVCAEEKYPAKPINTIVGYAPGGSSDTLVRILAKYAPKYLGTNIVVVNIKGGGGTIGAREVLNSKPDGYTTLVNHQSMFTGYHTGIADFNFDDFTPVCGLSIQANLFGVRANSPWKTLNDIIEYAKKHPGELKMGANIGATTHFQTILLQILTNNAFRIVATGGDADRITKILGGHTDISPLGVSSVVPYLKSGKLRALAVLSSERDPSLPDVPTIKEMGIDFPPMSQQWGLYLPPGAPESVVKTLSSSFKKLLADPDCVKDLAKVYIRPFYLDTEEFVKYLYKEDANYYYLARVAGLKPKMVVKK